MTARPSKIPNFHVRRLSRKLVELRTKAGLTQKDPYETTRIDFRRIWRFENGEQIPRFVELNALLDLYGVPSFEWAPYQDMWNAARQKGWWHGQPLRNIDFVANEQEASYVRDVQLTYVPELLQTEEYARRVLDTCVPPMSNNRLSAELSSRLVRQQRLDADSPVKLHALIYQPVIHARVDKAQLRLLADRADQANVTLQILPRMDEPHGALAGSFTLLSFADQDEPNLGYTSEPLGLKMSNDLEVTRELDRIFKALVRRAMSPRETRAYLDKLLHQRRLAGSGLR
jgi:transcriptional regulator with XRE-family HTH domain